MGDPKVVHFREQAAMAPARPPAGFAGVANQDDKEVQIWRMDSTMQCGPGRPYSDGGEKLEENGHGMASVWGAMVRTHDRPRHSRQHRRVWAMV